MSDDALFEYMQGWTIGAQARESVERGTENFMRGWQQGQKDRRHAIELEEIRIDDKTKTTHSKPSRPVTVSVQEALTRFDRLRRK